MVWLRKNHFTLLLIAAVALAFAFPGAGRKGGYLHAELTTRLGIVLIFLMQGLSLATTALAAGFFKWRLHLFAQSWNFLLAPGLLWLFLLAARPLLEPAAWSGFWYLAILPTTVSSAVALTAVARGDTAGAIFNATLSNLLGVVLVPLWTLWLFSAGESGGGATFGELLRDLSQLILIPLIAGQLLRPIVHACAWFARLLPGFRTLSGVIIVFIIHAAFAESVATGSWNAHGWAFVLKLVLLVAVFLALLAAAVWWTSPLAGRDPATRIAAFFCGSQKTLAAGVPMANAIFAGTAIDLSLLLLPLLTYHSLQLLLAGFLLGPLPKPVATEAGRAGK